MKKIYLKSRKSIDKTKVQLQNRLEKIAILEQNIVELTDKWSKKEDIWQDWENKITDLQKVAPKNPILRIWRHKQNLVMAVMDKTTILLENLEKQINKAKKEYKYRESVAKFDNSKCTVVEKEYHVQSERVNLPRKIRKYKKQAEELKEKGKKAVAILRTLEQRPGTRNAKKTLPTNWRKRIITKYAI